MTIGDFFVLFFNIEISFTVHREEEPVFTWSVCGLAAVFLPPRELGCALIGKALS